MSKAILKPGVYEAPATSWSNGPRYYPCDYATFIDLKELHILTLRAFRRFRNYQRWVRKALRNRVRKIRSPEGAILSCQPVSEPKYPEFCTHMVRASGTGWDGDTQIFLKELPEFVGYYDLLFAIQAARKPSSDPDRVVPLVFSSLWRNQLEKLREYFSETSS